jgi:hypothetical protein
MRREESGKTPQRIIQAAVLAPLMLVMIWPFAGDVFFPVWLALAAYLYRLICRMRHEANGKTVWRIIKAVVFASILLLMSWPLAGDVFFSDRACSFAVKDFCWMKASDAPMCLGRICVPAIREWRQSCIYTEAVRKDGKVLNSYCMSDMQ